MSQSALDINENMVLDNANGCLQREDAVRFGISRYNNQKMKSKLRIYTRLITDHLRMNVAPVIKQSS